MTSADPLPELTDPESELELEPVDDDVPPVVVVPDEMSVVAVEVFLAACDAAAAPIPTVATTAATARPEVTATVVR